MGLLILSACTRQVQVSAVKPSKDLSGLTEEERAIPDWAAFEAFLPAKVARSIRQLQLSNVTFSVFRCDKPEDYYPAEVRLNGKRLDYHDLKEPLPPLVKMMFYVPQGPGRPQPSVCAAFDARGYSLVFLRGQTVRLPPLSMILYHYDEKTGRFLPSER